MSGLFVITFRSLYDFIIQSIFNSSVRNNSPLKIKSNIYTQNCMLKELSSPVLKDKKIDPLVKRTTIKRHLQDKWINNGFVWYFYAFDGHMSCLGKG